jgi:hypothetical protein
VNSEKKQPTFAETTAMPHPILLEDWNSYDNRKIKDEKDPSKFSCSERWETEYLAEKLKKHYPLKSPQVIMQAIQHCCSQVKAPHPREKFVECVVGHFVSE